MNFTVQDVVCSEAQLDEIFSAPAATSIRKETPVLTPAYRRMIEASPFCAIATVGPEGLDCSPRGDLPGFVRVVNPSTLILPERRGNNRVDTLRNLVRDARVSLLFLVPGISELLRVNGRAVLSRNRELCDSFTANGRSPAVVIVIAIDSVYFQCARAVVRSGLWDPSRFRSRFDVPTAGTMLAEATNGEEGGAAYDAALPGRIESSLY